MSKDRIKHLIASRTDDDGLTETGIKGVRLFRATRAIPCAPVVYEPCVVAIVSGAKEAVYFNFFILNSGYIGKEKISFDSFSVILKSPFL